MSRIIPFSLHRAAGKLLYTNEILRKTASVDIYLHLQNMLFF